MLLARENKKIINPVWKTTANSNTFDVSNKYSVIVNALNK